MSRRRVEYEQLAINSPSVRRWVNQCGGCGRVGVKPDAPEQFSRYGRMGSMMRAHLGVLPLDERGMCELCARLLDERMGDRSP